MPTDILAAFKDQLGQLKEFSNGPQKQAHGLFNMLYGVEVQAFQNKYGHGSKPDTGQSKPEDKEAEAVQLAEIAEAFGVCKCQASETSLERDEENEELQRKQNEVKEAYFSTINGALHLCHTCNQWEIDDSNIILTPSKSDPSLFFCSSKCENAHTAKAGKNRGNKYTLDDVAGMSVKELKASIKIMGLQRCMIGMTEKRELVDLVKENIGML
jgi:hypothetical protein